MYEPILNSTRPFIVIIPARLASTRLPNKPLIDIGGKPMIVRTAERAAKSGATRVIVATDHEKILAICVEHGITARLTRGDHLSGTDRTAEVAKALGLAADEVVVNVQGDELMINPALIAATAAQITSEVPMATAAHVMDSVADVFNPNIVKVVLNQIGRALYFSRAIIPWHRDGFAQSRQNLPVGYLPLQHIGLYAYSNYFLQTYTTLTVSPLEQFEALEQLRVLWHGYPIAVYIAPAMSGISVDTPEGLELAKRFF